MGLAPYSEQTLAHGALSFSLGLAWNLSYLAAILPMLIHTTSVNDVMVVGL